jgi:hypothetical protein
MTVKTSMIGTISAAAARDVGSAACPTHWSTAMRGAVHEMVLSF